MKLSSRYIIGNWINNKVSLINIERALELPFNSLINFYNSEGPAEPGLETLLNIINCFPSLLDIADNKFNIENKDK